MFIWEDTKNKINWANGGQILMKVKKVYFVCLISWIIKVEHFFLLNWLKYV